MGVKYDQCLVYTKSCKKFPIREPWGSSLIEEEIMPTRRNVLIR